MKIAQTFLCLYEGLSASRMIKYDDLFPKVAMKPTLQSRRDLVDWACAAQNAYMTNKGAPEENIMDCTRYQALLDKYGPDYSSL